MDLEKIDGQLFSYYGDYFHDGCILKIQQVGNDLSIEMESTALYICDNRDGIPLSVRNTLYGILHLNGIRSMKKNQKEMSALSIEYEYGTLEKMVLTNSSLLLWGSWVGFGENKPKDSAWFEIKVEAREIYWENTADDQDPSLHGIYKGIPEEPPYGYPQWYIRKCKFLGTYTRKMRQQDALGKGHAGVDHYHRKNPESTNRHNECLDRDRKPCGRYEDRAHLYPQKERT